MEPSWAVPEQQPLAHKAPPPLWGGLTQLRWPWQHHPAVLPTSPPPPPFKDTCYGSSPNLPIHFQSLTLVPDIIHHIGEHYTCQLHHYLLHLALNGHGHLHNSPAHKNSDFILMVCSHQNHHLHQSWCSKLHQLMHHLHHLHLVAVMNHIFTNVIRHSHITPFAHSAFWQWFQLSIWLSIQSSIHEPIFETFRTSWSLGPHSLPVL